MTDPKQTSGAEMARLLPQQIARFRPIGEDGLYDRDTLFDLINGGAEVYRALNVVAVRSRRYGMPGSPEIIVDIFDMGSDADAFGAFHHDMHEGQDPGVGTESEKVGSNLVFWKGRYFISLVALGDSPATRTAVIDIGRAVAMSIKGDGRPPELIARLPREGLDPDRLHYFHDHLLLDHYYRLGRDNPLGLDRSTEGVLARYGPSTMLIAVCYPTAKRAAQAAATLSKERCVAEARGELLAVVCEAPNDGEARKLARQVLAP